MLAFRIQWNTCATPPRNEIVRLCRKTKSMVFGIHVFVLDCRCFGTPFFMRHTARCFLSARSHVALHGFCLSCLHIPWSIVQNLTASAATAYKSVGDANVHLRLRTKRTTRMGSGFLPSCLENVTMQPPFVRRQPAEVRKCSTLRGTGRCHASADYQSIESPDAVSLENSAVNPSLFGDL